MQSKNLTQSLYFKHANLGPIDSRLAMATQLVGVRAGSTPQDL